MRMKLGKLFAVLAAFLLVGCMENDIPYPIIFGELEDIEVQGMIGEPHINTTERVLSFTVSDTVDLRALRLTRLLYTGEAKLNIPSEKLVTPSKFPSAPFASVADLPADADTRVNLSSPVQVVLSTYQDYTWTIQVNQQVERHVLLDGQVGDAVIDPVTRQVVVYVKKSADLRKIKVKSFALGGLKGTVTPDPCSALYADGYDFSTWQKFYVQQAFQETASEWQVFVYKSDQDAPEVNSSVFARTVSATLTATGVTTDCTVEYRKQQAGSWNQAAVQKSGTKLTAEMEKLLPASAYEYRVVADGQTVDEGTFKTVEATPLTDGGLDNWHMDGKLWNPWNQGGTSFWDTGNKGATTIASSNSVPTDDTCNGSGKAACLESKYLVLKFAAGNLFTGTYVRTDGTNGVLDFGRPFTAFPTKLRFSYKYHSETINRVGDDDLKDWKGKPDSCSIYIILADWDKPFQIKTRKSERSLLDPAHDEHILAYSEFSTSESSSTYQTYTLPIHYKVTDRRPKYIVVVASASKYGDYFTGGEGSCLWVDNFELLYE